MVLLYCPLPAGSVPFSRRIWYCSQPTSTSRLTSGRIAGHMHTVQHAHILTLRRGGGCRAVDIYTTGCLTNTSAVHRLKFVGFCRTRTVCASRTVLQTSSGVLLSSLTSVLPSEAIARSCCRCAPRTGACRTEACRTLEEAQDANTRVESVDALNA